MIIRGLSLHRAKIVLLGVAILLGSFSLHSVVFAKTQQTPPANFSQVQTRLDASLAYRIQEYSLLAQAIGSTTKILTLDERTLLTDLMAAADRMITMRANLASATSSQAFAQATLRSYASTTAAADGLLATKIPLLMLTYHVHQPAATSTPSSNISVQSMAHVAALPPPSLHSRPVNATTTVLAAVPSDFFATVLSFKGSSKGIMSLRTQAIAELARETALVISKKPKQWFNPFANHIARPGQKKVIATTTASTTDSLLADASSTATTTLADASSTTATSTATSTATTTPPTDTVGTTTDATSTNPTAISTPPADPTPPASTTPPVTPATDPVVPPAPAPSGSDTPAVQ